MVKYKCIKQYPCSHGRVWNIGDIIDGKGTKGTYDEAPNWPEFWEKVVEKDYEILSFKDNEGKIWNPDTQLKDCWCYVNGKAPFYQEKQLLNFKGFNIHSIKRLSDGEIFSIGDKIFPSNDTIILNTIVKIELILNNTQLRIQGDNCYIGITNIIKCINPLFTTEDGVDIFDGDEYWAVKLDFTKHSFFARKGMSSGKVSKIYTDFSTKKAAEKYIEENKPMYSKKDIINIVENIETTWTEGSFRVHIYNELKKLDDRT